MTGHKRRASQQLTRNSQYAAPISEPTDPAVSQLSMALNTMMGAFMYSFQLCAKVCGERYTQLFNQDYTNVDIVAENHVQSTQIRQGNDTAVKRKKTKGRMMTTKPVSTLTPISNSNHITSKPTINATRAFVRHSNSDVLVESLEDETTKRNREGRLLNSLQRLDIDGCDEEEARQRIEAFWDAPALLWDHGPTRPIIALNESHIHSHPDLLPAAIPSTASSSNPADLDLRPYRTPTSSRGSSLELQQLKTGQPQTQEPRTPESLSRNVTTTKPELASDLSLLLLDDEEDHQLVASAQKLEDRARIAEERRVRARKLAEQKAKEAKDLAVRKAKERRLTRQDPLEPLIQRLDPTWEDKVRGMCSNVNAVLTTTMEGTELRHKDFQTLLGGHSWLNDEIINAYIEWIVKAANEAAIAEGKAQGDVSSTVPKFIAHNSFFYENLAKKGPESTARLMKRKKAPGVSLMEVDTVFVPICRGSHWTIGVVRPVAKTIEYFDSMSGMGAALRRPYMAQMRGWLRFQLGGVYKEAEWKELATGCALQTNGYDCGVFVCTNALCVAMGLDTSCYKQSDLIIQRKNIAAVLLNRGFEGEFAWARSQRGLLPGFDTSP